MNRYSEIAYRMYMKFYVKGKKKKKKVNLQSVFEEVGI